MEQQSEDRPLAAETAAAWRTSSIPAALNLELAAAHAAVNLYQFFVVPLWLLPLDGRWGWTLVPLALLANPFWSLIHEAIHDLLHPDRRINAVLGRSMSVLFGSPFGVLRASHLLHHRLNRSPAEGTEYYDRTRRSFVRACPGYYFQILGGLYAVEAASALFFLLPRSALAGLRERFVPEGTVSAILFGIWLKKDVLREIRQDGVCALAWLAASAAVYGANWGWLVFVVAARAFLISFLDNVYHYGTPVNDLLFARNLRLPGPMERMLLHFNLHGVHHRNPSVPWIGLPESFRRQGRVFHGGYFSAAARQIAGPVALQTLPWANRPS
ncbi:MAG TPA: fatty acid desaturase [candidate division Zixibacteria bacterium]|nr:fatty acid desaturase [candidate division Zixibacteria bacterium]